jgi:hypothetical protein
VALGLAWTMLESNPRSVPKPRVREMLDAKSPMNTILALVQGALLGGFGLVGY